MAGQDAIEDFMAIHSSDAKKKLAEVCTVICDVLTSMLTEYCMMIDSIILVHSPLP